MSRIDVLIDSMTISEKIGQLTMTAASYAVTGPVVAGDATAAIRSGEIGNLLNIYGADRVREVQRVAVDESRLGVPLLIGLDVIHGHRTMFPVPLAEASAFDPELWRLTAREAAREAAADGVALTFAPMVDVSRDPRWGRSVEGPGEDPWLACRIAQAKIAGFHGSSLAASDSVASCVKHFCAYGPVTAGREYASVDISERTLRDVHLPAFAAAVAAGTPFVMPAFTDLAGIPMTANRVLIEDELRGKLGFEGVVVSDYNAVAELIRHGVAADLVEAAALALNAGVDVDMMADAYRRGLPAALERGLVRLEQIDRSVRRVLVMKERLGLFDDPYRRGSVPESEDALAARRGIARRAAARAAVLLKNEGVLPLKAAHRRIALIGPLADAGPEMRGPWWAAAGPNGQVSPLQGFKDGLEGRTILHAQGVPIEGDETAGIAEAVKLVGESDLVVLCLGERATMSGEAASRVDPGLPGRQQELADAVCAAALAQGKPAAAVLFSGRPLIAPRLIERAHAVMAAWFLGSETGGALADLFSGRESPGGRTPVSWARSVGQVPIFYSQRPSGRPANPDDHFTSKYLDSPNEPLFPFGHGLTYGRFELSNLRASALVLRAEESVTIEVDLVNRGEAVAEETTFLFVHDKVASVARPVLELKGFAKTKLRPGECGAARFALAGADLRFLGSDLAPRFEPGELEILVGPCADREQLLVAEIRLIDG